MEALTLANRLYEATAKKDAKLLVELLDDQMLFEGPVMRSEGAAKYIAMNEQLLPFHRDTRMLRQFAKGNDACSIYEMDLATPQRGLITLHIADWIRTRGDRITEQRIYYDAREFAKAFGM